MFDKISTLQISMGWFPEQAGGLNRFYYDCSKYFPLAGIGFHGLVAGSTQVSQDSDNRVKAFSPRDSKLLRRCLAMRKMAKLQLHQNHYDLVVSHFALYTAPIVRLLGKYPLVMHFHGPWALEGQVEGGRAWVIALKKKVEKITYRRASQFIVLSQAFEQVLHEQYAIPKDKIHVIPAGVDVQRFQLAATPSQARAKLGWSVDRPVIFAARRLAKRMGLENLIDAMKIVHQRHPEAMLYIAGKGAERVALQQKIVEHGLSGCVELLGFISDEDLLLAYRAANFSVVPTVAYEGFGLIVIESLAMGTPVMGTPVDAIPEILRPLSEQTLFESSAAADLAAGMAEVLDGRRVLPSPEVCQRYVQEHYDWSIVSQRIKAVYQQAIDEYVK